MGKQKEKRHLRLIVNDRKFSVRIVFFSHTKPARSNNPRSYTIVSAPAEQAENGATCARTTKILSSSTFVFLYIRPHFLDETILFYPIWHKMAPNTSRNRWCSCAKRALKAPLFLRRSRKVPWWIDVHIFTSEKKELIDIRGRLDYGEIPIYTWPHIFTSINFVTAEHMWQ